MPPKVPTSAAPIESAQSFRRLIERAHRVDDAKNRGHNAERRQSVGDRLTGVRGLIAVVRQSLYFLVHQRLDFVCSRVADDDEAPIVADEHHQLLVPEQLGKILENLGFARVVEMRFDLAARLGSQFPHQCVQRG